MRYLKIIRYWCAAILAGILPVCVQAQGLDIKAGAHLIVEGNTQIVLQDAVFINNGTFNAGNSTLVFRGTASTAASYITGSSAVNLYNLTINKALNDVQLNRDVAVSNILAMVRGNIELNGSDIDLGSTGNINGESEISRITGATGTITATAILNSPAAVNPGNMGIEISSAANLGSTLITRGHAQQTSAGGGGLSILRYYDVAPSTNTGLNAIVRFRYFDAELAGRLEPELNLWASTNAGITWTLTGKDNNDDITNWVIRGGISQFNRLTLGSIIHEPLPVRLLYFRGAVKDNQNWLYWATEQEVNSNHFELEHSVNGNSFTAIAAVPSHGNSNIRQQYQYLHQHPANGANYYRLKSVDLDGKSTYSPIVKLNTQSASNASIQVYPNPVTSKCTLLLFAEREKDYVLHLYNHQGQLLENKKIRSRNGMNIIEWNMTRYTAGAYYIVFDNKEFENIKIIKQ